jgi:CRP/FNR family cyclic AMP-dependent transcriptional regulator
VIEATAASLGAHTFLHGMPDDQLAVLAETASVAAIPARYRLFEEGGYAARFWLIRSGRVTLDMCVAGEGRVVIETVGRGGALGWSWLFPPYQWALGAVAAEPVEAFAFDAAAVRARCASDPALGYELTRRLLPVVADRLRVTRLRLLGRYGHAIPMTL